MAAILIVGASLFIAAVFYFAGKAESEAKQDRLNKKLDLYRQAEAAGRNRLIAEEMVTFYPNHFKCASFINGSNGGFLMSGYNLPDGLSANNLDATWNKTEEHKTSDDYNYDEQICSTCGSIWNLCDCESDDLEEDDPRLEFE